MPQSIPPVLNREHVLKALVDLTSGRMTFLKELSESQNCGQLAAALAKLTHPAFGYHWVDLMIGTHFDLNPERSNDLPAAARMLEPFRPWMRSSR